MSVVISDDILQSARLSEQELRQEVALMLFERERLTLAQAARLATMERLAFQHLVSSRNMTVHYDIEEFQEDIETLRELGRL